MTFRKVKVAKAPLLLCLQCPLCFNLVHAATTISECLHTFCRSCIYQHLGDDENDCCPICNVNLGCSPLEKLRADHQLNDLRTKIFPATMGSGVDDNDNIDVDATSPIHRKERTLSSLGIGATPSSHPGLVDRRTKSVYRKTTTARDVSSDDETSDRRTGKLKKRKVSDKDSQEESSSERISTDSVESESLQGETILDSDVRSLPTITRGHHSPSKKLPQISPARYGDSSKLEPHPKSQILERASERMSGRRSMYSDKLYSGLIKISDESLIDQSPLAQLAEVAVDEALQMAILSSPKTQGPRTQRGKLRNNETKSPAVGGCLSWKMMLEHIRGVTAPQTKKLKPNIQSPVMGNQMAKKVPIIKTTTSTVNKIPEAMLQQDKLNTGFWFSLQAGESQFDGHSLPQISSHYLRIKDGNIPVSTVKKYLMRKLDLRNENEVEIKCRGHPVLANLPLEEVRGIWLATAPSFEMLPALKELNTAAQENQNRSRFMSRSAEDCIMVLTYSRQC